MKITRKNLIISICVAALLINSMDWSFQNWCNDKWSNIRQSIAKWRFSDGWASHFVYGSCLWIRRVCSINCRDDTFRSSNDCDDLRTDFDGYLRKQIWYMEIVLNEFNSCYFHASDSYVGIQFLNTRFSLIFSNHYSLIWLKKTLCYLFRSTPTRFSVNTVFSSWHPFLTQSMEWLEVQIHWVINVLSAALIECSLVRQVHLKRNSRVLIDITEIPEVNHQFQLSVHIPNKKPKALFMEWERDEMV